MSTFLPKGTELVTLYEELGIVTSGDVNWSEGAHVPSMKARAAAVRPHQLMRSDWIERQLTWPIREAILTDECGIGKTL
ncbi:hypothetical protein CEP51_000958 [Fusarium floridanum]|nr:hypothetical protein CEP51_000958 [Fusarium floridanum]